MDDFDLSKVFGEGPWTCHCGIIIDWPGACDKCAARWHRQRETEDSQEALSTIPDRFAWAKFSAAEHTTRVNAVCSRAARTAFPELLKSPRDKDALILFGAAGSGKTTIAVAILQQLVAKMPEVGARARFVSAIDIAWARQGSGFGHRPRLLDAAVHASVLFVDDLGAEPANLKDGIVELVQDRHNANKPTVYTTWQERTEIETRYGGGVGRRIYERGTIIEVVPPVVRQETDGGSVVRLAIE